MKILVMAILFAMLALVTGCFAMPVEEPVLPPPIRTAPEPRPIRTTLVTRGDVFRFSTPQATYMPVRTETLRFSVADRLIKGVYAQVGDHVREGDILAELEDPNIDNQLQSVRQDENWLLLQLSQVNERLRFAIGQAEATGTPFDDSQYLADRARFQSELDLARMRIYHLEEAASNLQIRAPFDGVIIWAMDFSGVMWSGIGQNVISIVDQGQYIFRLTGPYVAHFEVGQMHEMTIYGQIFLAEVIDPEAESIQVGSPDSEAFFRITDGEMPEVTSRTRGAIFLLHDAAYDVLMLPNNLINTVDGRVFVHVMENGILVMRDVEIGLIGNTQTEIISGLEEGDEVAVL